MSCYSSLLLLLLLMLLHARDAAARPPRTNIQTFLFLFAIEEKH